MWTIRYGETGEAGFATSSVARVGNIRVVAFSPVMYSLEIACSSFGESTGVVAASSPILVKATSSRLSSLQLCSGACFILWYKPRCAWRFALGHLQVLHSCGRRGRRYFWRL